MEIEGVPDRDVPVKTLLGLSYAAAHLWADEAARPRALRVLQLAAAHTDPRMQANPAHVFDRRGSEYMGTTGAMDSEERQLIQAIVQHEGALDDAAYGLVEAVATRAHEEPALGCGGRACGGDAD